MNTRRKMIALFTMVCLLGFSSASIYADNRDREITVMTYNMYPGTDFSEIFGAQSIPELVAEVAQAYGDVQSSIPADRVDAIADQIQAGSPTLVGLQEVALWRTGPINDPAPATAVA